MTEKRRHHYIPQFYLRGFADPTTVGGKALLWVRDVRTGMTDRRTPKNLAVEVGYYAIETDQGSDYKTLEDELARMEDRAAHALHKMLDRPVGEQGPMLPELSSFIAWLACRTPWFKRIAMEGWPKHLEDMAFGRAVVEEVPEFSVLMVNTMTGEKRKFLIPEALGAIRTGRWIAQMDQNQVMDMMRLQRWYFQHQHFPKLFWTILTAPAGDFFVVSDRPVVWYVPDRGFADSPAALKYPEVELTVPLNARTALLGTGSLPSAGTQIRAADVNYRTRCFAERFVAAPNLTSLSDRRTCFV